MKRPFTKVRDVPWVYGELMDASDSAYVIPYKRIDPELKLEGMVSRRFSGKVVQIAKDVSLRAFYVFVKEGK